jgi:hypothetical protein
MTLFVEHPLVSCLALLLGIWGCVELGRHVGARRYARSPSDTQWGTTAIEGSILALFGLLVAFTFSGAANRFDHRRELIVSEANAIGTAYLRVDVAPMEFQKPLRDLFRRYTDSRLAAYDGVNDLETFKSVNQKSTELQREIWTLAVAAGSEPAAQPATNMLLLPAINEMFDVAATRAAALQMHPPLIIFLMLLFLALTSAVLAGHSMMASPSRNSIHTVSFAAIMTAAIYIIIDLEYPRLGLIGIDGFDQIIRNTLR